MRHLPEVTLLCARGAPVVIKGPVAVAKLKVSLGRVVPPLWCFLFATPLRNRLCVKTGARCGSDVWGCPGSCAPGAVVMSRETLCVGGTRVSAIPPLNVGGLGNYCFEKRAVVVEPVNLWWNWVCPNLALPCVWVWTKIACAGKSLGVCLPQFGVGGQIAFVPGASREPWRKL